MEKGIEILWLIKKEKNISLWVLWYDDPMAENKYNIHVKYKD